MAGAGGSAFTWCSPGAQPFTDAAPPPNHLPSTLPEEAHSSRSDPQGTSHLAGSDVSTEHDSLFPGESHSLYFWKMRLFNMAVLWWFV